MEEKASQAGRLHEQRTKVGPRQVQTGNCLQMKKLRLREVECSFPWPRWYRNLKSWALNSIDLTPKPMLFPSTCLCLRLGSEGVVG